MNWKIQQRCDLPAGTYKSWSENTYAYTGDNNAHSWVVEVFENGASADLSGYSSSAYFIRADGNTVLATGTISGNAVSIDLPQSCYSVPGVVSGVLKITKTGSTVTVGAIKFSVSSSTTNTLVDPEDIVPSVDELLSILAEIDQITDAENARVEAEQGRVQAEQERVAAEQGRVQAEQEREATIAQIEQNAESGEYDGATFTPNVSAGGMLSWTNDKGLTNPQSVNIKGESGVYVGTQEPTDSDVKVWINPDGESTPILDDESVGAKPWSSLQIIDTLCPPLEVAGNPVQCYPVANYPLGVKASWEPRQEGTGDPSPENVRPITGLDEVTVTLSDGVSDGITATLTLPETIYGGTVDAVTGEGSENWRYRELDGTESISLGNVDKSDAMQQFNAIIIDPQTDAGLPCMCNILPQNANVVTGEALGIYHFSQSSFVFGFPRAPLREYGFIDGNTETYRTAFSAYLAAQFAAGTPVTIAYKLATPQPIQATGSQSLPALPGTNTIYTDADSVTVTGRADPNHTINALNDRIAALEDAATGG